MKIIGNIFICICMFMPKIYCSKTIQRRKEIFSTNATGTTGYPHVKKKKKWIWTSYLTPYTKSNSKWIKDLNVKAKIIRKKHKCKSVWSWIRQWFLRYETKSTNNERNKLGFIEIKNSFGSKNTNKEVKRQPSQWERNLKIYYPEYIFKTTTQQKDNPV